MNAVILRTKFYIIVSNKYNEYLNLKDNLSLSYVQHVINTSIHLGPAHTRLA